MNENIVFGGLMRITTLDHMIDLANTRPKKRLVVVSGQDYHTLEAVIKAVDMGLVDATIIGNKEKIDDTCYQANFNSSLFDIVDEPDEVLAASKAVDMINDKSADVIMKGLISSAKFMKAILNKKTGLMDFGSMLTHVTIADAPNYHKLIIFGDVAIIPEPNLNQKILIAQGLINAGISLGIEKPKLAVLASTEKVNPNMQACVDAAILSKMAQRGQIVGGLVDGPLSLDTTIDMESVEIKGIKSDVAGDADCLLFPDLDFGNGFYKTLSKIAHAELAAVITGARAPAILSSRGDSMKTKLYSLVLGSLIASNQNSF